MKKKSVLFVIMLVLLSSIIHAQDLVRHQKIGIARVNYILMKLPEMKQIETQLKEFQEQLGNLYNSKVKEYDDKYSNYISIGDSTPDIFKKDFEEELLRLRYSIEKFENEANISLVQRQNKLLNPVRKKVFNSINEVADQMNFTLILNYDIEEIPIVLHYHDSIDISNTVLAKLGVE